MFGVESIYRAGCRVGRQVRNRIYRGMLLGRAVIEGESPVPEIYAA